MACCFCHPAGSVTALIDKGYLLLCEIIRYDLFDPTVCWEIRRHLIHKKFPAAVPGSELLGTCPNLE